ncbi:hypothetical protein [Salinispora fenicalii]|uniref:hypothetical protein n=1 Tax=Salinispora fenicalii TaxID=1137263 RepID=UPI00035C7CE5|nr:hypothetical protein [Salinispora fenicalii]
MRTDDTRNEATRRAEERIAGDRYGEGVLDEVTVPQTDVQRVIQDEDPGDPAHSRIDPQVLRDGGPTRGQGAITTTGGTAGPASVRRVARQPERHRGRVAPTTTGDATTGGLSTPTAGSTSDAAGPGVHVANLSDD